MLVVFPLQQWLHERASMLRYTYITCLVSLKFVVILLPYRGPGSSVGIATETGPGAHPASCTMGIGSFPGLKRPGRGADYPPLSSAEVEDG
jgi:hypothetical protein